jgi:hypothetical protein
MREKIEHRVGVRAPAEVIWKIAADIEGWPAWNPVYPKASGQLRIGAVLELELALENEPRRILKPVILDWVPNEQILWRLSMLGGLVRTRRYIEIEKLSETGCILSNGELFEGPLGNFVARRKRLAIKAGFTAMGEALKARAEAAWRAEGGDPTSASP